MQFFVWILICGSALKYASGQYEVPCVYKRCWCYGNMMTCNGLGFNDIPPMVGPGNATDISFDMNNITHISAKSLPPNIQRLSMPGNPLTSMDDSAFDDSINTLNSITLSWANFIQFPNAFGRLRKLETLDISNSRAGDWNGEVMKNLGITLRSLTLRNCSIQTWPYWFQYFNNLTSLSFAQNFISTIPDNGLDSVTNTLTYLDLQNNSLASVPRTVSKLLALQTLYFQYNRISDIAWLPPNSKLKMLYISYNKIYDADQLSKTLLPYADSLEELYTGTNNLHVLPKIKFLQRVTYLDFSYNQISDSVSGDLPLNLNGVSLYYNNFPLIPKVIMTLKDIAVLVLNDNSVTQIRDFEFPPWVVGAEFGFNFITELTDNSFPANCSLHYINLNNNPLHKISSRAFHNLPLLTFLNAESSRLTRLPLGLLSGKGLTGADFTGSTNLVCTCDEKGLITWITSLEQYAVTGNCGRTTIHEFYTTLAHACP